MQLSSPCISFTACERSGRSKHHPTPIVASRLHHSCRPTTLTLLIFKRLRDTSLSIVVDVLRCVPREDLWRSCDELFLLLLDSAHLQLTGPSIRFDGVRPNFRHDGPDLLTVIPLTLNPRPLSDSHTPELRSWRPSELREPMYGPRQRPKLLYPSGGTRHQPTDLPGLLLPVWLPRLSLQHSHWDL